MDQRDENHRGPGHARPFQAGRGSLAKAPSGIQGLDEITGGGLPKGRPTLVCGGAGCGKTLLAMEFLVRGATRFGEPGVFMAFEETAQDLAANVASLGFDLEKLQRQKKLAIDYVQVERSEIEETGEYDLEGLFVRLRHAIDTVGAKRVVLDTIESLFSGLPNQAILRAELRRLFRWLKERGQTVILTGEKGEGSLTRHGLEEYVSDCVIFLDHRITDQTSTRRLRVVKYRGSTHGTNEYPFLIDEAGMAILPVTSLGLTHKASSERLSSGVARLDEMLGGQGYFKGSTILTSGTAGSGKTSLASLLAQATCQRGERCLFFAFEESADQLTRNLRSVGIRLGPHVERGLLRIVAGRPTTQGLEAHLVAMNRAIDTFAPSVVVVDPITNLINVGSGRDTRAMLTRLIDFLKMHSITAFFTSLTAGEAAPEQTEIGISSLIDTWVLLEVVRSGGERNRAISIVKSRGMAHSNQTSEFVLSERGFRIIDTYLGTGGVLTGSARLAREAQDHATALGLDQEIARKRGDLTRRRRLLDSQITALQETFVGEELALQATLDEALRRREALASDRIAMGDSRHAFTPKNGKHDGKHDKNHDKTGPNGNNGESGRVAQR